MTILHFKLEPELNGRTNEQIEADCIYKFRIHGASKPHSIYLTQALFFALDKANEHGIFMQAALSEAIKFWSNNELN
jgi:hypothetical protein